MHNANSHTVNLTKLHNECLAEHLFLQFHAVLTHQVSPISGFCSETAVGEPELQTTVSSFRTSSVSLGPAKPLTPEFYHNTTLQNSTSPVSIICLIFTYLPCWFVLSSFLEACSSFQAFYCLLLEMFLQISLPCACHIGLTLNCTDSLTYNSFIYCGHDSRCLLLHLASLKHYRAPYATSSFPGSRRTHYPPEKR